MELQKIANWYCSKRLAIYISKTKYIIFRSRRKKLDLEGLELYILCSKLSKSLYYLRKVKHFINQRAAKMLYFSLFHSHLLYCLLITSSAQKTQINRIIIMQKKQSQLSAELRIMPTLMNYLKTLEYCHSLPSY